jgi:hypothetical protein
MWRTRRDDDLLGDVQFWRIPAVEPATSAHRPGDGLGGADACPVGQALGVFARDDGRGSPADLQRLAAGVVPDRRSRAGHRALPGRRAPALLRQGLHELPLAEVASGRHDPKDLWPQGFVGGLIQLGGFLGLALTPLGLVFVGGTSAALGIHGLLSRGLPRAAAAALVVLAVACAVGLAWFLGDTSQALTTWRLD